MEPEITCVEWGSPTLSRYVSEPTEGTRRLLSPLALLCEDNELDQANNIILKSRLSGIGAISRRDSDLFNNYKPLNASMPSGKLSRNVAPSRNVIACLVQTNDYAVTRRCLLSLIDSGTPCSDIVLLDNGSDDGSGARLWIEFPQMTMLAVKNQLPYCTAFNLCASVAVEQGGSYILILNNDLFDFSKGFVKFLKSQIRDNVIFSSPSLLDCRSEELIRAGPYSAFGFTHEIGTECFLVSSVAWSKLGGFRENFKMYGEDLDLLFRSKRAMRSLGEFSLDARMRHDCGQNTQRVRLSGLTRYLLRMRNLVWLNRLYPEYVQRPKSRTIANYLLGTIRGPNSLASFSLSVIGALVGFLTILKEESPLK